MMKHWKTKEEMGNGFSHTQKKHKESEYNYLMNVEPYEKNTMRTHYLIRDVWNKKQVEELEWFIDDILKARGERTMKSFKRLTKKG